MSLYSSLPSLTLYSLSLSPSFSIYTPSARSSEAQRIYFEPWQSLISIFGNLSFAFLAAAAHALSEMALTARTRHVLPVPLLPLSSQHIRFLAELLCHFRLAFFPFLPLSLCVLCFICLPGTSRIFSLFFFGAGQKLWKFINHINLNRNVRRPGRGSLVQPLFPPPALQGLLLMCPMLELSLSRSMHKNCVRGKVFSRHIQRERVVVGVGRGEGWRVARGRVRCRGRYMKCRLSALNKLCGAFDLTEQQEEAQKEGGG